MTTIPQPYPMPALDCPSWCITDHLAEWDQHLSAHFDARPVPAAGGGFLPGSTLTVEQWGSLDYFCTAHTARAVRLDLGGQHVEVQQQQLPEDGAPTLYLEGEGALTAQQARDLAAILLDAADRLTA